MATQQQQQLTGWRAWVFNMLAPDPNSTKTPWYKSPMFVGSFWAAAATIFGWYQHHQEVAELRAQMGELRKESYVLRRTFNLPLTGPLDLSKSPVSPR